MTGTHLGIWSEKSCPSVGSSWSQANALALAKAGSNADTEKASVVHRNPQIRYCVGFHSVDAKTVSSENPESIRPGPIDKQEPSDVGNKYSGRGRCSGIGGLSVILGAYSAPLYCIYLVYLQYLRVSSGSSCRPTAAHVIPPPPWGAHGGPRLELSGRVLPSWHVGNAE